VDKVVIVCCGEVQIIMGDSRKYPYHTTDGFSEFRLTIGIPKAWEVLDLGFPQETDKSVFLENTNFMDF